MDSKAHGHVKVLEKQPVSKSKEWVQVQPEISEKKKKNKNASLSLSLSMALWETAINHNSVLLSHSNPTSRRIDLPKGRRNSDISMTMGSHPLLNLCVDSTFSLMLYK